MDMPWRWSKGSQLILSLFVALVLAVLVFHHRFHQHYTLYTIEVAQPGETIPAIDPETAGALTFLIVLPVCYTVLRIVANRTQSR